MNHKTYSILKHTSIITLLLSSSLSNCAQESTPAKETEKILLQEFDAIQISSENETSSKPSVDDLLGNVPYNPETESLLEPIKSSEAFPVPTNLKTALTQIRRQNVTPHTETDDDFI